MSELAAGRLRKRAMNPRVWNARQVIGHAKHACAYLRPCSCCFAMDSDSAVDSQVMFACVVCTARAYARLVRVRACTTSLLRQNRSASVSSQRIRSPGGAQESPQEGSQEAPEGSPESPQERTQKNSPTTPATPSIPSVSRAPQDGPQEGSHGVDFGVAFCT